MKKIKTNSGITLVALIITIIVLLILAVVSIRAITGGEGIFTKTENATQRYEEERIKEENTINGYETIMKEYIILNAQELNDIWKGKNLFQYFNGEGNFVFDGIVLTLSSPDEIKGKNNLTTSDFVPNIELEMGSALVTYKDTPYTIVWGVNKEYDYTNFEFEPFEDNNFYGINPVILRIEEGHKEIGNAVIH